MRISAGTARQPQYALVFAGEHMETMRNGGWSREDVQRYCFEHSQASAAEIKRANIKPGGITPDDENDTGSARWSPSGLSRYRSGRPGRRAVGIYPRLGRKKWFAKRQPRDSFTVVANNPSRLLGAGLENRVAQEAQAQGCELDHVLLAVGVPRLEDPGTAHRPGNADGRAAGWQP